MYVTAYAVNNSTYVTFFVDQIRHFLPRFNTLVNAVTSCN